MQQQLPEGCPPLTNIHFYLSAGCNMRCHHCWITPSYSSGDASGSSLSFDTFEQAIEEALPLGLQSVLFTGGEPLLNPWFTQITEFTKEKGIPSTLETNGTLVNERIAQHLKERSSVGHVSVSIDGADAVTHDRFRGIEGSFERACNGIRMLAEVGYKPQIIMSLHRANFHQIESVVTLAETLGCGSVKFNLITGTVGSAKTMRRKGELLTIEELIRLGEFVEGELQQRTDLYLYYSWPVAFCGLRVLNNDSWHCCFLNNKLGVLADGRLGMCGIAANEPGLSYGILGEDRLLDVWTSNPTLLEQRKLSDSDFTGICSRCAMRGVCRGYCPAYTYHETKSLTAPFWFCRMAEEAGMFPSSRCVK